MGNWSDIYPKLEEIHQRTGGKITVDSAFAAKESDALIKTSNDLYDCQGNVCGNLTRLKQAKGVRILSEWGNGGFQASFPRITDIFMYKERGERKIQISCMVFLYNFRASTVGFNQIQTVFMPYLQNTDFYE